MAATESMLSTASMQKLWSTEQTCGGVAETVPPIVPLDANSGPLWAIIVTRRVPCSLTTAWLAMLVRSAADERGSRRSWQRRLGRPADAGAAV